MTNEEYILTVLRHATVFQKSSIGSELRARAEEVARVIKNGYPDSEPTIRIVGSYAKGTMIQQSYDLDLICYFERDEDEAGGTLEEIYHDVKKTLEARYTVNPKTSALRIKEADQDEEVDFHIDVVPGRYVNKAASDDDVFIFQKQSEKCRLKTNLEKHLSHIRDSTQTDTIRIAKLWRELSAFELKTFILELLVIDIVKTTTKTSLSDRFEHFLREVKDNFEAYRGVKDPANSNNDLSTALSEAEDAMIAAATLSLDVFEDSGWAGVFPAGAASSSEAHSALTKRYIVLDRATHAAVPPWPRKIRYRVEISGQKFVRRGSWRPYESGKMISNGTDLKFTAKTDAPHPCEIKWQVVNTGNHAAQQNGLRGEIFSSLGVRGSNSQFVNNESTRYSGRHWIQCFVVQDGWLVAESERFEVPIVNASPERPSRFWIPRRR